MAWVTFVDRSLATAAQSSQFRDWAGSEIRHDLLLGSQAHAESLAAASATARHALAAPLPGQVMLVRNGAVERLNGPTASTRIGG